MELGSSGVEQKERMHGSGFQSCQYLNSSYPNQKYQISFALIRGDRFIGWFSIGNTKDSRVGPRPLWCLSFGGFLRFIWNQKYYSVLIVGGKGFHKSLPGLQ